MLGRPPGQPRPQASARPHSKCTGGQCTAFRLPVAPKQQPPGLALNHCTDVAALQGACERPKRNPAVRLSTSRREDQQCAQLLGSSGADKLNAQHPSPCRQSTFFVLACIDTHRSRRQTASAPGTAATAALGTAAAHKPWTWDAAAGAAALSSRRGVAGAVGGGAR
eukprot:94157-Chlamydomonas_euryale.AAC.1